MNLLFDFFGEGDQPGIFGWLTFMFDMSLSANSKSNNVNKIN